MRLLKLLTSITFSLIVMPCSACDDSTAPNRVVYIGDSHTVGTFGDRLSKNLEKLLNSAPIKRYGVVGSAAQHWSKKDSSSLRKLKIGYYCDGEGQAIGRAPNKDFPLPTQLFQGAAPTVLIALGTNDLIYGCKKKDSLEQMASVKELLSQIRPQSNCVWIGPTEQATTGPIVKSCGEANVKKFVDNLKNTVSQRCTYIDSREVKLNGKSILPNRNDQLHYDGSLANYWADSVTTKVQNLLHSHNIEKPSHVPELKNNNVN